MPSLPERFVVIGLDGADLDLLRPWMEAGDLPNLAGIAREGVGGYLASTLPPVSAPAWATFMTGRNPGRHGLFGFVMEDPETGGMRLVNLGHIRGAKLWEAFGRDGSGVVVVNVPITYPPPEVNGVFVSGMLTPAGRPFTWPPDFGEVIRAAAPEYRIDIDRGLFSRPEDLREHLSTTLAARGRVVRRAMEHADFRLLVAVFTNTDRIQHHFWRGEEEKETIRGFFREVDREVGEILARVDPSRTLVMVMSDHGFTDTDRRFYANRWLRDEGYLAVRRVAAPTDDYARRRFNWFMDEPEEARHREKLRHRILRRLGLRGETAIDWSRTRAYLYSSDTRGIHVNLAGRQPRGIVPPGEYEALRDEIAGRLRALRFPGTGEPVFDLVAKREEIYEGPYVDLAPDILLAPERDRYRVVTKVAGKGWCRRHRVPDGYHRRPGLLLARGPGVRPGAEVREAGLADVMPTLLFAAGLPSPSGVDGRVLREIFTEDLLAAREETRYEEPPEEAAPDVRLTAEEDEALRRTLADLGYL